MVHVGARARGVCGFGATLVVEGGAHAIRLPRDVGILSGDGGPSKSEGYKGEDEKQRERGEAARHFGMRGGDEEEGGGATVVRHGVGGKKGSVAGNGGRGVGNAVAGGRWSDRGVGAVASSFCVREWQRSV